MQQQFKVRFEGSLIQDAYSQFEATFNTQGLTLEWCLRQVAHAEKKAGFKSFLTLEHLRDAMPEW